MPVYLVCLSVPLWFNCFVSTTFFSSSAFPLLLPFIPASSPSNRRPSLHPLSPSLYPLLIPLVLLPSFLFLLPIIPSLSPSSFFLCSPFLPHPCSPFPSLHLPPLFLFFFFFSSPFFHFSFPIPRCPSPFPSLFSSLPSDGFVISPTNVYSF